MKHDNSYELRFSGLKVGVHTFDWRIDAGFLHERGVDWISKADLSVTLEVEKKERLMDLMFHIEGDLISACDRCGEDTTISLDLDDLLVVKFAHETDLTDDEVVFIDDQEHHIEVSQFIYEFIMVGLPGRIVHPEGECDPEVEKYLEEAEEEGTEDEKNNDIDPRWEALKKLKQ